MKTLAIVLLLATGVQAGEYPISFQIRISSDVGGKYAGAESQDIVIDSRALFAGDSISTAWVRAQQQRNVAVSGADISYIAGRFASEIPKGKPAYAHILAGTNDFYHADKNGPDTGKMLAHVDSMLAEARKRHIPVIVGTVLPADPSRIASASLIPVYNAQLIQHVGRRATIADYYSAMVLPSGAQNSALFYDGIHPNAAGYAVMNKVLDSAIAEMQRRRAERKAKWQNATPEQRAAWREKRKNR